MKKGFTLVELLGVIILLGLIVTIVTPVIGNTINTSRNKAYDSQVNVIETAAKEWGVENIEELPEIDSDEVKTLQLTDLINSGKLQSATIINPKTKAVMTGCVAISYNSEYKQYEYKYTEENVCD